MLAAPTAFSSVRARHSCCRRRLSPRSVLLEAGTLCARRRARHQGNAAGRWEAGHLATARPALAAAAAAGCRRVQVAAAVQHPASACAAPQSPGSVQPEQSRQEPRGGHRRGSRGRSGGLQAAGYGNFRPLVRLVPGWPPARAQISASGSLKSGRKPCLLTACPHNTHHARPPTCHLL